ncbi:MAG TPA: DNA translocase FtsK, partial [Patescibacteria group bacterium]|nr:DNA translocase FtsK [Patescibacteria group bacterium]
MGRRRKRAPFRLKLKKETIFTVASLILIILAILSALSLFMSALVLDQMSSLTLALFGWTRYLFPLVLITAGFSLTRIKWDIAKGNVFLGITLLWMAFISLTRAGELGDAVFEGLSSLVSTVGAVMLLITVGVVGVVVLFNTSLDAVVSSLGALFQSLGNFFKLYILRRFLEKKRKPLIVRTTPKFDFEGKAAVKIQKDEITPMGERKLGGSQLTSELVSNVPVESGPWTYPPLTLLNDTAGGEADRGDIKKNAATIEDTLESFGIQADVTEVNPGPAVTQYALEIALGTKLSKITALQNNLALALATKTGSLRIEAPIPGRPLVGIEVPNITPQIVTLKQMLVSKQMQQTREKLVIPLWLNVAGDSVVFDIAKMPHVLIAGQTGSGKSVAINSFITTLLFRTTPTEVKLILVDPKRVELTGYNGIPHLLTPVIVEVDKVISALKWAINEMERRYKLFQSAGEKNIEEYNSASGFQALPYILIFIDELADIMAYAPSDVEDSICRLAQMARATGIHLVLST